MFYANISQTDAHFCPNPIAGRFKDKVISQVAPLGESDKISQVADELFLAQNCIDEVSQVCVVC